MPVLGRRVGFTVCRIWRKRRTEGQSGVEPGSRKINNAIEECLEKFSKPRRAFHGLMKHFLYVRNELLWTLN